MIVNKGETVMPANEEIDLDELFDQAEDTDYRPGRLAVFLTDLLIFLVFLAVLILGVVALGE